MNRLRVAPYKKLARIAEARGFELARRKTSGSHRTFKHRSGRRVVIPNHGSTDLPRPLIRAIVRQMEPSVEEYHRLLDEV